MPIDSFPFRALTFGLPLLTSVALVALLASEARGSRKGVFVAKPIASLAFVALGLVLCASVPRGHAYAQLLVVGLVLGAAGDVALMFRTKRTFLIGLVLFLLGHLAYVAALLTRLPSTALFSWLTLRAVIPPVLVATLALRWLNPHVGKMRIAVYAYVAVITVMEVCALTLYAHNAAPLHVPVGATLFFASDFAVARERFVKHSFINKLWGLPAYYAGQVILAFSLSEIR